MKRILFAAIILNLAAPPAASAQDCPAEPWVVSRPATEHDVYCKTLGKPKEQRCADGITLEDCEDHFALAYPPNGVKLLTEEAYNWLRSNGFCPITFPARAGLKIIDFCPPGCFAAETNILTSEADGSLAHTPASAISRESRLLSLSDESSLQSLEFQPRSVARVVSGPETPPLYVFHLSNGAVLRVTQHHPMVLDSGVIVDATQVKAGDSFVEQGGQSITVEEIARETTDKKVYNFQTTSETQLGHVIVAEGVLIGDLKLQNDLAREKTSIQLRR